MTNKTGFDEKKFCFTPNLNSHWHCNCSCQNNIMLIKVNTMHKFWLFFLVNTLISGCTATNWQSNKNSTAAPAPYVSDATHSKVEKLTRQLFSTSNTFDSSKTLAVGTISPTMNDGGKALPEDQALALQIQESLMTFATQAGLKVIEYKTRPSIKISNTGDSMFSRNVNELKKEISADYFLTGTYTIQENTTMINLRLIQVPENIVVAAATDYMPNDVMWSQTKVTLKNNQIYRNTQ